MNEEKPKKKRGRPFGAVTRVRKKLKVETQDEKVISFPRGRMYDPSMCDTIKQVAEEGGHVAAMCLAIGVRSRQTFYDWLKDYPDFAEAYEEAKLISLSRLEVMLTKIANGDIKGNFSAVAMLLNNKYEQDYRRNVNDTQINIGSINSIEMLDSDSLDEKIRLLQKKLDLTPAKTEVIDVIAERRDED